MSLFARRRHVFFSLIVPLVFSAASAFGQCGSLGSPSTSWNVAGSGDFSTAGNWSAGLPNSATNACIVNGTMTTPSVVNLGPNATGNVLNLQLNANNTLNVTNNAVLNVYGAQIINGGAIGINSAANNTFLVLQDNVTLSGAGVLTLSTTGASTSVIEQAVGGLTLTNQSTIQGAGIIGNNGLALVNSGTVDANSSTGTLTLNGGAITNTGGTLEATGGGTLNILNSVNNGNITADGGIVNIQGNGTAFTIDSATLTSKNGGTLQTFSGGYASFNNVTLSSGSTYTNGNNAYLYINGTMNNQGTINVTSGANNSVLWLNGNTTLTGGGVLNLSSTGAGSALIDQTVGGLTLTNVNNTIQGAGIIGNNGVALVNQATVNANISGQSLTLQGPATTNTGATLEATTGGILNVNNSVNGGTILADGGTVNIEGNSTSLQLSGVTLTNKNGGTLQTAANGFAYFNGVTLSSGSTYTNGNNAYLFTAGTINNQGTINVTAGNFNTVLWLDQDATLTGGGIINLSTTGAGTALIDQTVGGLKLTNVNNTIQGAGIIGNNGVTLVNQATVNANISGQTLVLEGSGSHTNTGGLMEATNGGILQINGATVNNSGGNITGNGGTVQLEGSGTIQGGTLNGTLATVNGNNFTLDGSTQGALTLSSGSAYNVNNNSYLFVQGSIVNNGALNINAGAFNTIMWLNANTTLSGSGALTLFTTGAGGTAFIEQSVGGLTLTNQETIQGAGVIGANGVSLANQATVNANISGQTLVLEGSGSHTNAGGVMEATNGGIFQINGATVNNSGGTISSSSGGTVQLQGSGTVQGGTLSGNFETINGNNFTLDGSTHGNLTFAAGSVYNVNNNSYLFTQGNIVNNGAININAGTFNTVMWLQANTTLSGSGALTLGTSGGGTAFIDQTVGGLTLTNQSTIQGTGFIGNNGVALQNDTAGTLLARTGDSLTIQGSGGLTNNGTMQVNPGGTMTVTTNLTNFSGGTLTGGTYILNGATGNTGTMQINSFSGGNGITTNDAAVVLNGPTASTLFEDNAGNNALRLLTLNSGNLTVEGGYALNTASGGVTNSGTVTIGAGSSLAPGNGSGTYTQNAGVTQGTGIIRAASSMISGGALLPGASTANPGTFTFQGNLALGVGGSLSEGITGSAAGQFGVTNVSGTLNINSGALLNLINSTGVQNGTTSIGVGTQLTIMSSSGLTGAFNGVASGAKFNNGNETWTVGNVGNNVVLNATPTAGFVTATWSGPSGNWTANSGSPNFTTNWSCDVPVATGCVPVDNHPTGINYVAVLNSPGNTMTLSAGDTPNNPVVNSVTVQAGTLVVDSGANLQLTVANNGGFTQTGGTTQVDGTISTFAGGASITGGTLQGTGSVNGNTIGIGASANLLPGDSTTSPGTLSFANNLVLGGTLEEVLNGSAAGQFGVIDVGTSSGSLMLNSGSVLDILQASGFNPVAGTTLIIALSNNPIVGSFSSILNDTFNGGTEKWTVLYNPGGLDEIGLQAANINPASVTATWSTASGNWTTATQWSCAPGPATCVPNNGGGSTYAAILNSPGNTLTLNSAVTVNSVDVQNGTLAMNGGNLNAVNTITVEAGTTVIGTGAVSGGSLTVMNVGGGSGAVIADGGTLDLSGITVTNLAGGTLTNGTWQAGGLAAGTLKLPGNVVTNSAGIFLQNPGSTIVNGAGTNALAGLTSNQAGFFTLFNGATFTTGGSFTNNNGSGLNASFGGSALTVSGDLNNTNNSLVTVNGNFGGSSIAVTGNLNNDGTSTIQVQNGGALNVGGNVNNSGTFTTGNGLPDTGGNTVTVTGAFNNNSGGVLNLFASGDNLTAASFNNTDGTVNVEPGATLNAGSLSNSGSVSGAGIVNASGTINAVSFSNTGFGAMNIYGVNPPVPAGIMNVDASAGFSSNTNSTNATIYLGGALNFIDPGFAGACPPNCNGAQITGGGTINLAGGTLTWASNMFFQLDNHFIGNGTLSGGTIGVTPFTLLSGGTITPTGNILIASDFNNDGVVTISTGNSLTINGAGGIGNNNTANILVNGGTLTEKSIMDVGIASGATGTLTVNNGGTGTIAGDLNIAQSPGSSGIVNVTGVGSTLSVGGNVNTTGAVTIGPGGALAVTGDYTESGGTTFIQAGGVIDPNSYFLNGGTTDVDGTLDATTVTVGANGTLTGSGGTINAALINNGVISPGTGSTPGVLSVNGDVSLGSTSMFIEQILGLNSFGQLLATGNVFLDGTLDIQLLNGYLPSIGNTFLFIDPPSVSGVFATINGGQIGSGEEFLVAYNANDVELCVVSTVNPVCGSTPPPPVPEPRSILLMGTVVAAVLWRVRRRNLRQKLAE